MEETFNTKAIILDRFKFRESDMKLIIWSRRKGRLELVARGALKIKSKTAGHVEPLTLSKLMIIKGKKDIDYIGTAVGETFFKNIKSNLKKIELAGNVIKLIKKLTRREDGGGESIFFLLNDFLVTIDEKEVKSESLLYSFFVLKFLSKIGFTPNLQNCSNCSTKITEGGVFFFDVQNGGIICKKCLENCNNLNIYQMSDESIKVLRFCLQNDFTKLNSLKISKKVEKEVKIKIDLFFKYHI